MKTIFKTISIYSLAFMLILPSFTDVKSALNSFVKECIELEEECETLQESKSDVYEYHIGSGGGNDNDQTIIESTFQKLVLQFYTFQFLKIKSVSQTFRSSALYLLNCSLKVYA